MYDHLIISPQALRYRIPPCHIGASNFPISPLFSFLSTIFLRPFIAVPRISRAKETLVIRQPALRFFKNDSLLFATIDIPRARDRNSFIRISQMRIHRRREAGKKKDQFKHGSVGDALSKTAHVLRVRIHICIHIVCVYICMRECTGETRVQTLSDMRTYTRTRTTPYNEKLIKILNRSEEQARE